MKKYFRRVLTILVLWAIASCAGLPGSSDESTRTPTPGKALLVGVKPGGTVELIIRTVDGKIMGELPFKPAYEAELDPGTHQIGPFCTVKTSYGKQFGPTEELKIQMEAGHIYKLHATPGGKMCTVRVEELTTKMK